MAIIMVLALTGTATAHAAVLVGDQSVESTLDSNPAGSAEAFPIVDETAGSATSISLYLDTHNQATALTLGLYRSNGQNPGPLMASGHLSSLQAGAWNTVSIPATPVSSGQTYWLTVLGTGGTLDYRDRNPGPCKSVSSSQTNLSSLPSTWTTGTTTLKSCPVSGYVTSGSPPSDPPPVNTAAPAVSGTATQGQVLTTTNGSWSNSPTSYTYAWDDCSTSGTGCTAISGATSSTYTLQASDVGHTIESVVTAHNAGGSASAASAPGAVVTAPPSNTPAPVNTAAPAVSGTATQGQVLTTTNGSWSNSPTSYTYAWDDCSTSGTGCTAISGATSSTYTLQASDVGHTIESVVTAHNSGGSASAASAATGTVTASSYSFDDEFTGTSVSSTLWSVMDQHGDESNNELECYLPANTTEASGVLTEQALSQTVSCPDGSGTVNYTSGAVQMRSYNFEYGTVEARIQFAGGAGTWPAFWLLGAQCQRPTWLTDNCGWPTPGSQEIDIAEIMNDGGPASTVHENLITQAGTTTCQPDLSGIATGYHVYTLVWTPSSLTFKIDGKTTCTMTSGIPNGPMFVILNTALGGSGRTNISGLPQSTNVDYVHVTTNSPVNTALPVIAGSATAGSTLTASAGSWTGSPSSFSYQWQRCTSAYYCVNISGGTGSTYQLGSNDVGNTVQVVVSAQSSTGGSMATSAATGTVG